MLNDGPDGYDFRKAWFKFLDDYELDEGKVKLYGADAINPPGQSAKDFNAKLKHLDNLRMKSETSSSVLPNMELLNSQNPFKGRRKTFGQDEIDAQGRTRDTFATTQQYGQPS